LPADVNESKQLFNSLADCKTLSCVTFGESESELGPEYFSGTVSNVSIIDFDINADCNPLQKPGNSEFAPFKPFVRNDNGRESFSDRQDNTRPISDLNFKSHLSKDDNIRWVGVIYNQNVYGSLD
jgi:hypothetical protein